MKILHEMAYSRSTAVDECFSKGKQFISHFYKVMEEGNNSVNFHHHCSEMQAFWDDVKNIRLKPKSKLIAQDDLMNWFFTIGSDVNTYIKEDFQEAYHELYLSLLLNRKTAMVEDIMIKIFSSQLEEE